MTEQQDDERWVTALLDRVGPEDAPDGFADGVMARVSALERAGPIHAPPPPDVNRWQMLEWVRRQFAGADGEFAPGGGHVAKKLMWAGVAIAVVVLVVAARYSGWPPEESSSGTIGAAARYQGAQPTAANVVLTDAQVQEVMQSDVFDALLKNKAALALFSNPQFQAALSNPQFQAALSNPQFQAALSNPQFAAALSNPQFAAAFSNPQFAAVFSNPQFAAAFSNPQFAAALSSPQAASAVSAAASAIP